MQQYCLTYVLNRVQKGGSHLASFISKRGKDQAVQSTTQDWNNYILEKNKIKVSCVSIEWC